MNPLDLRGPEFLIFYTVFAALVIGGVVMLRRWLESGAAPQIDLSDPYLIATLRAGAHEALRVGLVSLVDRGLLESKDRKLVKAPGAHHDLVRRPMEKRLLQLFDTEESATVIFHDASLKSSCEDLDRKLRVEELLPGPRALPARVGLFAAALVGLWTMGGVKIAIAFSRGRHNVIFLIVLMVLAAAAAAVAAFPRRTARGSALLADLRSLYADLKRRAPSIRPGGATVEASMLAAVFGLSLLPKEGFGFARKLFPREAGVAGDGGGYFAASSGSSCGGSSCGGGGCGGGCGGCGS